MKGINIKAFVESYLVTAAWIACDLSECTKFKREAIKQATSDCELFMGKCEKELGYDKAYELLNMWGSDLTYVSAHDFYLTRNNYGSGFWDKKIFYGEYADKLTEIAKSMGQSNAHHERGPKSKLIFD